MAVDSTWDNERRTMPRFVDLTLFVNSSLGVVLPHFAEQRSLDKQCAKARAILQTVVLDLRLAVSDDFADRYIKGVLDLTQTIRDDAESLLRFDPAAKSFDEVVLGYPGFYATAVYRMANMLHKQGVKLLPRLMTELAHQRTGIDIHPGATIGSQFCIDHGTGVVIGETTIVGDRVKIYQGVTLGALSVAKTNLNKRHPTIENDVIIYANATVLGGDTVVGEHSVIGGSTWITSSVPAHSVVFNPSTSEKRV